MDDDFELTAPLLDGIHDYFFDQSLTRPATPRSNRGADKQLSSPINLPNFNPVTLLNPKAAAFKSKTDPQLKVIQSNDPETSPVQNGNSSIFGDLFEKHHGVTRRQAGSMKRTARHDQDEEEQEEQRKKKGKFDGGSKGGIIGESINEIRQQARDEAGPPVVDLTTGDDDDFQITGSKWVKKDDGDQDREVCMGYLKASIHADTVPAVSNKALDSIREQWPVCRIGHRMVPGGQGHTIEMLDKNKNPFGKLASMYSSVLGPLFTASNLHKLRCSVILLPRPRKPGEQVGQAISENMQCHITLFAAFKYVVGIGKTLSQKQHYLYSPVTDLVKGKEIVNPHLPKLHTPGEKSLANVMTKSTITNTNTSYHFRSVEEIKDDVQNIIDNLPNSEGLPLMEVNTLLVKTPLLEHQKQALYWMTNKETVYEDDEDEDVRMWKTRVQPDRSTVWYNVITGEVANKIPICHGGLFSDEMGLGKTLSTLSRIAVTRDEAIEFGKQKPSKEVKAANPTVTRNTRATLIVCPKSVLSNWDEQIKAHLDVSKGKIKYFIHHGYKRPQDEDDLANYDIVISTYSTVTPELRNSRSRYKAIARLNWFRVVLDEAHMIRNMQTGTFHACCALSSPRRWAVTGTPVQNRLDDLGALIKFIKIKPFDEKGAWEQYFTSAWKSGNEQVLPNLKLLVSSIMLRRSKKKINIEDAELERIELAFTDEERSLYEAFAKDSTERVQAMLSTSGLRGKGTAHMLTFITRLRLICCHGRELLGEEDMKLLDGRTMGTAIDLGDEDDDKPVLSDYQIYSTLSMMRDSNANLCAGCSKEIGSEKEISETEDDDEDESSDSEAETKKGEVLGYMTPCYHLLCNRCIESYTRDIKNACSSDNYSTCPICQTYIRISFPTITRSGILAEEARRAEVRANPQAKSSSYSGPHTKVQALLSCLQESAIESSLLPPGEPPIRSVVFSGWTQYLDLISLALNKASISHVRLDGKMSVSARSRVLEQFRTDPAITVILISIRAGGQGLNLTAASRVYMMEPQFNPGVEAQAVDRVHRLGQTRQVKIVKFIMRDSFEGKIVKLQEQKLRLANEALGGGGTNGEGKTLNVKERMEGLRSLFR